MATRKNFQKRHIIILRCQQCLNGREDERPRIVRVKCPSISPVLIFESGAMQSHFHFAAQAHSVQALSQGEELVHQSSE